MAAAAIAVTVSMAGAALAASALDVATQKFSDALAASRRPLDRTAQYGGRPS